MKKQTILIDSHSSDFWWDIFDFTDLTIAEDVVICNGAGEKLAFLDIQSRKYNRILVEEYKNSPDASFFIDRFNRFLGDDQIHIYIQGEQISGPEQPLNPNRLNPGESYPYIEVRCPVEEINIVALLQAVNVVAQKVYGWEDCELRLKDCPDLHELMESYLRKKKNNRFPDQRKVSFEEILIRRIELLYELNRDERFAALLEGKKISRKNNYILKKRNELFTAEDYYEEALEIFDENDEMTYQPAKELIEQAISINPKVASFYVVLGALQLGLQGGESGVPELKKAIKLDPDLAHSYYFLGKCYNDLRKYTLAIPELKKAIEIGMDEVDVFIHLGYAHYETEQYEKAIAQFMKAIEEEPAYAEAYYLLGRSFQQIRALDEAIEQFEKVAELAPEFSPNYNAWAATLGMQGKLDERLIKMQQMVYVDPSMKETYKWWVNFRQWLEVLVIDPTDVKKDTILPVLKRLETTCQLKDPIEFLYSRGDRFYIELATKKDAVLLFTAAKKGELAKFGIDHIRTTRLEGIINEIEFVVEEENNRCQILIDGKDLLGIIGSEKKFTYLPQNTLYESMTKSPHYMETYSHLPVEDERTIILSCTCGSITCNCMYVEIIEKEGTLIWKNFKSTDGYSHYVSIPLIFDKEDFYKKLEKLAPEIKID